MSANELALRFSTAPAEQLIGVLPVLEVKEALREEVEDVVLTEFWADRDFEVEAIEQATDALATAMKLALTQPAKQAKATLLAALNEYPGYGRAPVKAQKAQNPR